MEREILLSLVEKYPTHYKIHKMLAEFYIENNELEKAEDEYYSFVTQYPESKHIAAAERIHKELQKITETK